LTVVVVASPALLPAVPANVVVVTVDELPLAGAVIVTLGAVVSMRNVRAALIATLPAWSAWLACTVYVPSARLVRPQ
jgi:hypothetical protein